MPMHYLSPLQKHASVHRNYCHRIYVSLLRNLSLLSTQQQRFPFSTSDPSLFCALSKRPWIKSEKKKKIGLPLVIQHHLSPLILSSFHLSLSAFPSLFPKDTALCVCTVSLHVLLWTISNVSPWKGNAANCYVTSDEIVCVCASVTGLGFLSWSSNK